MAVTETVIVATPCSIQYQKNRNTKEHAELHRCFFLTCSVQKEERG
jgi:hypothetical protein